MPPLLPKYAQPPDPVQAGPVFWTFESCVSLPEWADTTEHPMLQVSLLMHLGHPLSAYMAQTAGYKKIVDELLNQLADLNAHPIQTLDRVLLVNTVVLPRLLYRCECYPLTNTQLQELSSAMERFVFPCRVYHRSSPRRPCIAIAPGDLALDACRSCTPLVFLTPYTGAPCLTRCE